MPASSRVLQKFGQFRRTYTFKFVVLTVIFLAVPIILYNQFRIADEEKNRLLLENIGRNGQLISAAIQADLPAAFNPAAAAALNESLSQLGRQGDLSLKLLIRPDIPTGPKRFFLIAAWPHLSAESLQAEGETLHRTGLFDKLKDSCDGNLDQATRFSGEDGQEELITSLVPLNLPAGCWVVITSFRSEAILRSSLGRAYWRTPVVQAALAIYVLMAIVVVWLFGGAWRNINQLGALARRITRDGETKVSFRRLSRIPEMDDVASEFDRMVDRLRKSADIIRQAAEENAHALKAPVAVISQAIEPIRRATSGKDETAARAVDIIEKSVEKLDTLVTLSCRLDETTAAMINPDREPVDLSALLNGMRAGYEKLWEERRLTFPGAIAPGVTLLASDELLEIAFENILDNAVSFSPDGGAISISLSRTPDAIDIRFEDEGPGADPDTLERMFERYISTRPDRDAADPSEEQHFGIGLWIVRRNIQLLGGEVMAENRDTGGLRMIVRFPADGAG